ncbi:DUF2304 domain-containing protein [Arthrobacter polaris]|uniref:DUF2304 domain-containing protein n=1 Tax=Arthrobacter polaris TaxID=2813727 RepID=UPI001F2AD99F|nr:DUF2304 domain-containing protein [Arthrobacter polaris]UIK87833.1 DUF2304 domain-containing protein [Arthrobacter polaris]
MQIIVQIALVLAVVTVSVALMRGGSNARHMAIRRILLVLFACIAALSIFFPGLLSHVARLFGIGRGTDLVLYGLIVSFLVFMATTYQRFRHMETTLTKLSRRIAIDDANRTASPVAVAARISAAALEGPESEPGTKLADD